MVSKINFISKFTTDNFESQSLFGQSFIHMLPHKIVATLSKTNLLW